MAEAKERIKAENVAAREKADAEAKKAGEELLAERHFGETPDISDAKQMLVEKYLSKYGCR